MITSLVLALAIRANNPPMLFSGLGAYHRPVTTANSEAQRYFDQGLAFLYGFNKSEARLSFQESARLDPNCGMAYWGIAMADGPDINNGEVTADQNKECVEVLSKAKNSQANTTERALLDAALVRYQSPPPKDRKELDRAFAEAMRKVWKDNPNDPDVGAMFAEALMDLHPWAQWHKDGTQEEGTQEVLDVLQAILKVHPEHPQAEHLYIHATEGGPHADWAEPSADRLVTSMPAVGHMVHMPSHTFVRTGRWQDAIDCNEAAIRADMKYSKARQVSAGYRPYMMHNRQMLAYAAMMSGQRKKAVRTIDTIVAQFDPKDLQQQADTYDGMIAMPLEVRIRFGLWDEVLAATDYPVAFPLSRFTRHYARAVAFAAKGKVDQARQEQKMFEDGAVAIAEKLKSSPQALLMVDLARHMMNGEILLAQDKNDAAIDELTAAVAAEDKLDYSEPPLWIMPTRHALGAVLIKNGRYPEAEAVYREDLRQTPNNGWALYGLSKALQGENRTADSKLALQRFKKVWARSDTPIVSSCMCVK